MSASAIAFEAANSSIAPTREVAIDKDPSVLRSINHPRTSMAVWERSHDLSVAGLGRQLRALAAEQTPHGRFVARADEIGMMLEECYQQPADSDEATQTRQALANDMTHLAEMFQGITKSKFLDVRIQLVRSDACRFWHRDSVDYRLLCTYYGPGTQWVNPELGAEVLAERDSWSGPCHDMMAGDVSLFAGSCAMGKTGIVHRSPPIKAQGKTRLVLCINTRSDG
ncbi:MAG: DUF1826 domain-containing protein [Alphaproteobacteria bacterium]|nr:DUF1826 domain-containing protein [Alphaproteobacteria bacterium SS10]